MPNKVFITGGTGSVGKELVRAFLANGFDVTFQYFHNDKLAKELLDFAIANKEKCNALKIDFHKDDLNDIDMSSYSILINNAAINYLSESTHRISEKDWNNHIYVNLTVPFIFTKKILPYLKRNNYGRIINISSIYGFSITENRVAYSASKHGLRALTKTVALEYGKFGITCNEIAPTAIKSKMIDTISKEKELKMGISKSKFIASLCSNIPAGRLCLPSDIVNVVLFLVSDKSFFINGETIKLHGGQNV